MNNRPLDFWRATLSDQKAQYIRNESYAASYEREENAAYIVWHSGLVADLRSKAPDWLGIAQAVHEGTCNFEHLIGAYRAVIYVRKEDLYYFFGDNSGSQYWFFDSLCPDFSDHLLELRRKRGSRVAPDIRHVSEMLTFGKTFGEGTLIQGIHKTDPDHYYCFSGKAFTRLRKGLKRFCDMQEHLELADVMEPLIEQARGRKICAVCTGGTDSRSVLAALSRYDVRPDLVLTGHPDNPDIETAQNVADALGCSLTVLDPSEKGENWLQEGFWQTDGCYDAVLSHRHYLKACWARENGYEIEFGGVGGEFYKNDFCHPFLWAPYQKNTAFYSGKVLMRNERPAAWIGTAVKTAFEENRPRWERYTAGMVRDQDFLGACNQLGFIVLRNTCGAVTNGYAAACCKMDPLMERHLIASASHEGPIQHAMQGWQRRQIAANAPELSDLATDQGYSCTLDPVRLSGERIKKLGFYSRHAVNRLAVKAGLPVSKLAMHYWDDDYRAARATDLWKASFAYCKEQGFLAADAGEDAVPLSMTGVIIQIGMLLLQAQWD